MYSAMNQSYGLGLRRPFYQSASEGQIPVDCFEVITENFMVAGGKPIRVLELVRHHYPIIFHGVSMNLGGTDPLDQEYLIVLKAMVDRFQPMWVSDHLCWTRFGGQYFHDLLPLPYTEEAIENAASRIREVQDYLQQQILIENVSSFLEFKHNTMNEAEFLAEVAERADCRILLDINNIVVNATNHGIDPSEYLSTIPADRVGQYHMAGHSKQGRLAIDTHDHSVSSEALNLYKEAVARLGHAATLLEWDDKIPAVPILLQELDKICCAATIHKTAIDSKPFKESGYGY